MKYLYPILSVILLLCLFPMPYGYYALVRFVSMVAFGVFAYLYYEQDKMKLTIIFASLALLFQPFMKIALGRSIWNAVDILVAIFLLVLWIKKEFV